MSQFPQQPNPWEQSQQPQQPDPWGQFQQLQQPNPWEQSQQPQQPEDPWGQLQQPQYPQQQGYNQPQWQPPQQSYHPRYSQYRQQPPMQPMQPQKKPRKPVSRGVKFGCVGAIALLVIIIAIAVAASGNGNNKATPTTQATQPAVHPTTQPTKGQPTVKAAFNPNNVPTHGTPHIGGPFSDFYGKYGQPVNQGSIANGETWIVDQNTTTIVNATPDSSGKTINIIVTSGANWSVQQTKQYCEQFLPSDASQFNTSDHITDYHSSVGMIVIQQSQTSCVITIGGQ